MIKTEGQRQLIEGLKRKQWTKAELARRASRSKPTVGAWVSGQYTPDVDGVNVLHVLLRIHPRTWSQKPQQKAA